MDERYLVIFSAKRCFSSLSGEASSDQGENLHSGKSFHHKTGRLLVAANPPIPTYISGVCKPDAHSYFFTNSSAMPIALRNAATATLYV
jgi:hypothetical protein